MKGIAELKIDFLHNNKHFRKEPAKVKKGTLWETFRLELPCLPPPSPGVPHSNEGTSSRALRCSHPSSSDPRAQNFVNDIRSSSTLDSVSADYPFLHPTFWLSCSGVNSLKLSLFPFLGNCY